MLTHDFKQTTRHHNWRADENEKRDYRKQKHFRRPEVKQRKMEFKQRRGIANQLTGTVLAVIIVGVLLVVGAVILGQLYTINATSLGNNSNASKMVDAVYSLLFTAQGVIVLVVVVALLSLVIYTVMSSLGGNQRGR